MCNFVYMQMRIKMLNYHRTAVYDREMRRGKALNCNKYVDFRIFS